MRLLRPKRLQRGGMWHLPDREGEHVMVPCSRRSRILSWRFVREQNHVVAEYDENVAQFVRHRRSDSVWMGVAPQA
jgi:hypothetical protein